MWGVWESTNNLKSINNLKPVHTSFGCWPMLDQVCVQWLSLSRNKGGVRGFKQHSGKRSSKTCLPAFQQRIQRELRDE